jgi:hypothetical protein
MKELIVAAMALGFSFSVAHAQQWDEVIQRLHDGIGNWDHLNLIFPVYLKLMTGFPTFQPENVGVGLLH